MANRNRNDGPALDAQLLAQAVPASTRTPLALDPERFSILKKQVAARPAASKTDLPR